MLQFSQKFSCQMTSRKMHLRLDWNNSLSWIRVLVFVGFLNSFCIASPVLHFRDSHTQHYTFLHSKQEQFAKELSSYEISIPTRVTASGEFVSHSVQHTRQTLNHGASRSKRDTNNQPNTDEIHYKLHVDDMELHVSLEPNHKLLSPGFVVERRPEGFRNISYSKITAYPENRCHFTGHIHGHPRSKVALATCDGLHGFLHTNKGQYLIEPVKGHDYSQGGHHPHLVYHRAALPAHLDIMRAADSTASSGDGTMDGSCGVQETYEEAAKERDIWERENRKETVSESGSHHRRKRSVSLERYVETLVVVDREMMEFYENEDLMTYVLTIMNMVSMLYHDSTLGNAVNIQLVNLMLMDYDEEKLEITHHADNTLRSFCKWQKSINPKDDKAPNHHDVAILLTRRNICAKMNEPCSTLGLSQVNGLCQPHRSCNINEDTGLSLAFTVAHEIGHNFGMQHDGEGNHCHAVAGEYQLLMQAQLNAEASPMVWSECSRAAITKFLDRDWGYCLDDESAKHDFRFDQRPPGVIYDADHQCRLQYGEEAEHCDVDNLCVTLWCKVKNKCMTRLEAAAEGTICDQNQWCSGGRCVPQGETPLATNGEWGEWGEWSGCSRSCGAGVAYRERHCDNPPPKKGGQFCLGERKRYRICNYDECPEDTVEFRDLQCKQFNNKPYKGKLYDWEYVSNPRTPCQLHCRPKNQFFSVMLKDIVSDGTPCPILGKRAMCISGLCRRVGCDWGIESQAKEDQCGMCRGDGSTCKTVKSNFNKEQGMGYVEAMVIPQGARNIRIEEVAEANNYLAVRNDNGEYYLNGGWFIQWNGDYEAGGTVMTYERVGDKEMLKAPGPLKESLHIMLLFQSENPGVEFQFTIPNENATSDRILEFRWIFLDWTHCTHSCGGGTQRSEVVCSETQDGIVDDIFCNATSRPEDMLRVCNDHPCPPRWWPGPWQHCSKTCGNDGVRMRTVLCVRSSGNDVQEALEDWQCEDQEKPINLQGCGHKPMCPSEPTGIWSSGPWSQCTRSCGGGIQIRDVMCDDLSNGGCARDTKPVSQQDCNIYACHLAVASKHDLNMDVLDNNGEGFDDNVDFNDDIDDDPDSVSINHQEGTVDGYLDRDSVESMDSNYEPDSSNSHLDSSDTDTAMEFETGPNNDADDFEEDTGTNIESEFISEDVVQENVAHNVGIVDSHDQVHSTTKPSESTEYIPDINRSRPPQSFNNNNHMSSVLITTPPTVHTTRQKKNPRLKNVKGKVLDMFDQPNIVQDTPSTTSSTTMPTTPAQYYMWVPLFWDECSRLCGGGLRTRNVRCFNNVTLEQAPDSNCQGQSMPICEEACNEHACLEWQLSTWDQCTASCGEGTETRLVTCPQPDQCDPDVKPSAHRSCAGRPCVDWKAQEWTACTATCGGGQKTRGVECIDWRTNQSADECDVSTRPSFVSRCSQAPCPQNNAASSSHNRMGGYCQADILSQHVCRSLKRMGRCWHNVVQYKCCRTCSAPPNRRAKNNRNSPAQGRRRKRPRRRQQAAPVNTEN